MKKKSEKKVKKGKKEKKELLDLNSPEADLTITANFSLEEVALKKAKGLRWRLKLDIFKILPKTYHNYTIRMDVDEAEFDNRIQSVEEKIEKIRSEKSLFAERDDKEIRDLRELIVGIENERQVRIDDCEIIEFVSEIEELKYKDGNTAVLMIVPDNIIEQLNKQKGRISYYKINLLPLL